MLKAIQINKKSLYIIYSYLNFLFGKESSEKKTSKNFEMKVNSISKFDYKLFIALFFISLVPAFSVYADDVNYSVTVEPALNITTSSDKVSLDLNPLNHDFDSQDLTVSVSTNNETGYKLYVNATGNKLIEKDDTSLYIETLADEVSENNFTTNRWGYRIGSGNYLPFEPGILLNSSKTATENNSSTLTFAAKVGHETKAGSYNLALNFQATANPLIYYIQDFTSELCSTQAVDNSVTVIDARDDNDYQVRYINGNCWMVQNLRYMGDTGSEPGSMIMKASTSNINSDKTIAYTDLTLGMTSDAARTHAITSDQIPSGYTVNDIGAWYNYAAASANYVVDSQNSTAVATESVCPNGWRLPTDSEQSSITSQSSAFAPVLGGYYADGSLAEVSNGGWWWSASPLDIYRYRLDLENSILSVAYANRGRGFYVRCIRSN